MLQKELDHQREQPRKEKRKQLREKDRSSGANNEAGSSEDKYRKGGRVHLGRESSPTSSSVGLCNRQLQIRHIVGMGSVPRSLQSELRKWMCGDGQGQTLSLHPWAPPGYSCPQTGRAGHLLFAHSVLLCLCTYHSTRKVLPLLH